MPTSELTKRFHAENARLMGYAALINACNGDAHDWFARLAALTPTAEAYYHDAIALLRQGRSGDAGALFRQCATLGQTPWQERAEQALSRMETEAKAILPRYPAVFTNAVEQLAHEHFRRSDYAGALALLSAFTEDNGEIPIILGLTAHSHIKQGQAEVGVHIAVRAAALDSTNLSVLHYAAFASQETGRLDQALAFARQAVSTWPQVPLATFTLAWVLLRQGHAVEAQTLLTEALEVHPNDASLSGLRQQIHV